MTDQRQLKSNFLKGNFPKSNFPKSNLLVIGRALGVGIGIGFTTPLLAVDDHTNTLPNAKPGQCFAKVMVPAEYRDETTTVIVKEGSEKVEVVPAKYNIVEERVMVADASTKLVPVPAVWGSEKQVVEISPASTSLGCRHTGIQRRGKPDTAESSGRRRR